MRVIARSTNAVVAAPAPPARAPAWRKVSSGGRRDLFEVDAVSAKAREKLDHAMTRQLKQALEGNRGRGGVCLCISQGGQTLFQQAQGFTDRTHLRPMTVDTPFDIASITKTFTATVVLQLVEGGTLDLDRPLPELLPKALVAGFDPKITLRQLLSHTSGLPDYWTDGPHGKHHDNAFVRAFLKDPDRVWQPTELVQYARELKTVAAPGKRYHYADTNYVLLGLIVERVTGQPLEQVFQSRLFAPLGLKHTGMTHGPGQRRYSDQAHRYEGKVDLVDVPRQSADWAGGGLVSDTADLETFFRALGTGRLFKAPATTSLLLAHPVDTGDKDVSYGLGAFEVDLGKQGQLWGHDGHGNSFAYYWPQKDIMFTGSLNQTENDWWPMVEKAISVLS